MQINSELREVYENTRVLFVRDGCVFCHRFKKFIERENMNIKFGKRIKVIDATLFNNHGIVDNHFIKIFDRFIDGFPSMFIDGFLITGANTEEEAISFLRSFLYDDYIEPEDKYQFDMECDEIMKNGRKIRICREEDY